jgi:hypothetical protein
MRLIHHSALLLLLVACSGGGGEDIEEGAAGAVVLDDGSEVALVDGRAFADDGEGGALKVLLTSFSLSCAEVEDGLGWSTPAGGVYVSFHPDSGESAGLYTSDGTETSLVGQLPLSSDVTEDGDVYGEVTFDADRGEATFRVEHCGSLDPFGS